jgi:hypothetical protein
MFDATAESLLGVKGKSGRASRPALSAAMPSIPARKIRILQRITSPLIAQNERLRKLHLQKTAKNKAFLAVR